jgi:hypothetical protein
MEISRQSSTVLLLGITLLGACIGSAPAPGTAEASEFTINACQADRAEFSTQAFEDFANRGMMWKRACDPEGPGLRGLVTANVVRAGRVERGARSYFMLKAPEGTRFARLTWSGQARRRDCRYALQLWAARPDGPSVAIKNVRANRGCPMPGYAQAAGWPAARTYNIAGATKIVQRVLCVGSAKTPYCSARTLNYIRTFKAKATVVDVSPPGVTISRDNPFTRGAWVRGSQTVRYSALDNVGVKFARAVISGLPSEEHSRGCNFAQRIPCPNGAGTISIATTELAEGTHGLAVHGLDAAGNVGISSAVPVRIDNTAPGAVPVALAGSQSWRNTNLFTLAWENPAEVDRAPITAARYRLCTASGTTCVTGGRATPGIAQLTQLAVPAPGAWEIRVWREDAAGNQQPANASTPVALRFDPEPPALGLESPRSSDPTVVSALVTDKISGLAGGQIDVSRVGSQTWNALTTEKQGSRLTTRVDDSRLPAGTYLVRATAYDHAENQSSTERHLDGRPMVITLPLRTPSAMQAGVVTKRPVWRNVRRGGKPRRVRRRVAALQSRASARLGAMTEIAGRLTTRTGEPLPNAEVRVSSRSASSREQVVAVVRTGMDGRYRYVTRADSTKTLRLTYAGSSQTLPAEREVTVLVAATSTIRGRPRRVRNGQSVSFTGRLRALPSPTPGKLVELQVVLSGRWQTFRTVRTTPDGEWRVRYRFRRSCGLLRYRFRARLPAESGYPFEDGRTRAIGVLVKGQPCG